MAGCDLLEPALHSPTQVMHGTLAIDTRWSLADTLSQFTSNTARGEFYRNEPLCEGLTPSR